MEDNEMLDITPSPREGKETHIIEQRSLIFCFTFVRLNTKLFPLFLRMTTITHALLPYPRRYYRYGASNSTTNQHEGIHLGSEHYGQCCEAIGLYLCLQYRDFVLQYILQTCLRSRHTQRIGYAVLIIAPRGAVYAGKLQTITDTIFSSAVAYNKLSL